MMRVMVALALPALASGATCSQAVCCTGITGMCKGNADAATDVTCTDANTINVGGVGTSLTVCCKDACLAAVCAADGFSTKADFATIAGTTEAECCDAVVTGKCSGNTAAADYTCTAGVLIAASATTTGETDAACCEVRCLASVCGGTGFTNTKVGFEAIVGATEAACCDADVTGKCSGNTDAANDHTCTEGLPIVASATTTGETDAACCDTACDPASCGEGFSPKANIATIVGDSTAECCDADITGKCSGNTDAATDHSCTAGVLIAASATTDATPTTDDLCCEIRCLASVCTAGFSTKADFATIVGDTTAECCDVTGMCNGNTLATADFVCSATSSDKAATLCTPAVKEATSGAATATVAASALALVAALL